MGGGGDSDAIELRSEDRSDELSSSMLAERYGDSAFCY